MTAKTKIILTKRTDAMKRFLSDDIEEIDYDYSPVSIKIGVDKYDLQLSEDVGNAGLAGYRTAGYAINADTNAEFRPYNARGIGRNLGLYHQAFKSSQAFQDAWGKIEQGLSTSYWYVHPVQCEDERLQELADKQAKAVQQALFNIDGGWLKHVREALYMLVAGFAPFIKIRDGFGKLAGLSFRYPSQVRHWIVDENQNNYIGIEFDNMSGDKGGTYSRLADELLVYSFRALGNDFEGISPMRSVYKFIQAHDLFCQLEAVAAEKFGSPLVTVERPVGATDSADDAALLEILDSLVATDNATIILPGGYKVTVSSPAGQMPNFEPVKRYCDEKIQAILQAEGSLVGLNGTGAYNLADIKDDQQIRSLTYYANMICSTINDKQANGHASLIQDIVSTLDEELAVMIEGQLPKLQWSPSPSQDDTNLTMILDVFKSGILKPTDDDEILIREMLKLPMKPVEAPQAQAPVEAAPIPDKVEEAIEERLGASTDDVEEAPTEKLADTALNGAQIASALMIVKDVTAGLIPAVSGIEMLKMAFLIDDAQAAKLLNLSPAQVPQAGEVKLEQTIVEPE